MKTKKIIFIVAIIIVLVSSITMAASASGVFHKQELSWFDNPWPEFEEIVDELRESGGDAKAALEIPVYLEKELIIESGHKIALMRDAGAYATLNARPNSGGGIMAAYPTEAIRLFDDGRTYTVYETETGYRLYLFFDGSNNYMIPVGFPIAVKELHSISDFSEIKIGDPIDAVEQIDDVATLHKRFVKEAWNADYKSIRGMAEHGYPCTGIYYLKEGLLRIEYDMLEDGTLVIAKLEFNKDHILTDILGNEIDCSIEEIDLPKR